MQIEAWFKDEDRDIGAVPAVVKPIIPRNGFVMDPGLGAYSPEESKWDRVTLNGKPVDYAITQRTEGHVVFNLMSGRSRAELAPLHLRHLRTQWFEGRD